MGLSFPIQLPTHGQEKIQTEHYVVTVKIGMYARKDSASLSSLIAKLYCQDHEEGMPFLPSDDCTNTGSHVLHLSSWKVLNGVLKVVSH